MTARREVKDLVKVEVLRPPVDSFILGVNKIGDLLSGENTELEWEDYTCDARGVSIRRGGTFEGVATRLDVGTATVDWTGTLPLNLVGRLQPNYPMRIKAGASAADEWPLFTGVVEGIRRTREIDAGGPTQEPVYAIARTNLAYNPRAGTAEGWAAFAEPSYHDDEAIYEEHVDSSAVDTPDGNPGMYRVVMRKLSQPNGLGDDFSTGIQYETPIELSADQTITVSVYFRTWENRASYLPRRLRLRFLNANGNPVSLGGGDGYSDFTVPVAGQWTRLSYSMTPAYGTSQVRTLRVVIEERGDRNYPTDVEMDATMVLIEKTDELLPYFDGNSAAETGVIYTWDGQPNASKSRKKEDTNLTTDVIVSNIAMSGVDAMKSLTNTTRYGAVVEGGVGVEWFHQRIARLANSARVPINVPPAKQLVPNVWVGPMVESPGNNLFLQGDGVGVTVTGSLGEWWNLKASLDSGKSADPVGLSFYAVPVKEGVTYELEMEIRNWGDADITDFKLTFANLEESITVPRVIPDPYDNPDSEMFRTRIYKTGVVAAGDNEWFSFGVDQSYVAATNMPNAVDLYVKIKLHEVLHDVAVQDVVYESSLANHFDLVTNSARAVWWVDRNNVVQFARGFGEDRYAEFYFSDVHSDDANHICYTEIEEEYSTENVVNNLTLSQHGRNPEDDNADDTTHLYKDETSIATWGAQEQTLETSVFDVYGALDDLAATLLGQFSTPSYIVSTIQFDAITHTNALKTLDLYSDVDIHGERYLVVGIEHSIAPEQWLCTLSLRKVV